MDVARRPARPDPGAATTYVAVAEPLADRPASPPAAASGRAPQPSPEEALEAVFEASPQALWSCAFALAMQSWLLPAAPWRDAWLGLGLAALAAAGGLAWAIARARRGSRARRRRLQAFVAAVGSTLACTAAASWRAGVGAVPDEWLLSLLLLAPPVLSGAAALAPVRAALAAAIALPAGSAIAAWAIESGWGHAPSVGVVAGLALGGVATGVGLGARRAWYRAVAARLDRDTQLHALAAVRDAAVRADGEKTRFLAAASHDLRQPVQALGLFATTLEKRLRGSTEEAIARNIVRSVDGLERSFNAMLDISRLDAGAIEPNFQHFPLRDLFRRLDMYFSGLAEQAHLGLRMAAGGKWITSDPQLLERLLGNLIQNAIKYTERGGIVVVARNTATHFNIEVWDTGMGIRAADLPNIFDEFFQVGRRERARVQGLGMGLAIVKRLAALLGHRLTVRSQHGRGTVFRIGIPIGGLPGIEDATAAADTLPMVLQDERSILVIDDDETVREGLALLLEEWGYRAIAAASFRQAERLARTLDMPPDLILSDLHLGDGPDGIEAIAAVRRECACDVPALLITGETSPEELRRVHESGHMVLCKPVQPRKLLNALRARVG